MYNRTMHHSLAAGIKFTKKKLPGLPAFRVNQCWRTKGKLIVGTSSREIHEEGADSISDLLVPVTVCA